MYLITWITTDLPTPEGWMAELAMAIESMALFHVMSEIFNDEKYRDLEIPVRGHSGSLNVVPFDRRGMVSY